MGTEGLEEQVPDYSGLLKEGVKNLVSMKNESF